MPWILIWESSVKVTKKNTKNPNKIEKREDNCYHQSHDKKTQESSVQSSRRDGWEQNKYICNIFVS